MTDDMRAHLDRYVTAFERLTPERLETLRDVITEDVRFADPFNDVVGADAFVAIFRHMYETVESVRFTVTDRAIGDHAAYLRWTMVARSKSSGLLFEIMGMSEIRIAEDGRVSAHIDYWDAAGQLYEKLPVLGWVLRRLRRRLAAIG